MFMPMETPHMRAVIYARYSTEMQRIESIEDQIEVCRRYAQRHGWTIVEVYSDAALSGSSKLRPAFHQMMADARRGRFDVLVCEAIDRLGRNLSDVSGAYDELVFARVTLHTVSYGLTTQMHIGIMGTMAQMAVTDIRDKVRRGQLGRARAGKIPGGLAYGYEVVPPAPGQTDGGERRIKPDEMRVVQRIFTDYAKGMAPKQIAQALNTAGIPGPGGRTWIDTTIRGQLDRGTGLLNNTLYIGCLSWNRCSYIKDPQTRRRVARVNPRSEWEIKEVPDLRIIEQDLWDRVKARQNEVRTEMRHPSERNPLNAAHRQKFLLSGLLTCGCCGGGYTIVGPDRYGCATRKGRGTCDNTKTVKRQSIERRVLSALKNRLLNQEAIDEAMRVMSEEMAAAHRDILGRQLGLKRELNAVAGKIEGLMQSIERGAWTPSIGERLKALENRQLQITTELQVAESPAPQPRLSPRGVEIYRQKVADLETSLNDPAIRIEATEALRSLIEVIVLTPDPNAADGLSAELHGELAALLSLASALPAACAEWSTNGRPPRTVVLGGQVSVVAGIGFEPMTFRL
jgi:site-specific DNA recombinase